MKLSRLLLAVVHGLSVLLVLPRLAECTNIKVTNPSVGTLSGGSTTVSFDVTWNSSWRISTPPNNWDAAWVFVKFSKNGGNWAHASLNNSGHTMPAGLTSSNGYVDTSVAFNIATNPVVGVFVYRNADGAGTVTGNGVGLSWNYSQDGVSASDTVAVQVFAVEMVYVSAGSFFAGDKATSLYSLRQGSLDNDPWYIGSENEISTTDSVGNGSNAGETASLFYHPGGGDAAGAQYTIPAEFPKGYQAFYLMKGEISQGQWVAFFNSLSAAQKSARDITAATGKNSDGIVYRNNVSWSGSGDATLPDQGSGATYEAVAMNYISWADVAAYLDWSGLRPMSELEFEKAGRGPYPAVAGEYPWGKVTVTQATSISNAGKTSESAQAGANCVYGNNANMQGPMRVGAMAHIQVTRDGTGAGYYGVMDLGCNLIERCVSVGISSGRALNGAKHGNGALDASGDSNVSTWPGPSVDTAGYRGGSWLYGLDLVRLSDRSSAANTNQSRNQDSGGRGARTAP